ncbi:hypothetical protein MRX96_003102 [Rhipicephalus microplus]
MVLKIIWFFPLRIKPCRLRFLVFFSLLDINVFVQSEIAGDAVAAVGTDETNKQTGPQASSSPSGCEPSTVEAPEAGPAPVGDTGKDVAATPVKVSCDSNAATEATTKATVCSAARQAGELKSLNEPLLKKCGVPSSNSVAASKRPHPQASNGGAETEVPSVEEPPAKTAQGRRPSLRPRPNLTADKRVGNGENAAGTRDPLAPSCGEAPERNAPADQEAQGDSAVSVNQPAAKVLPAALEVETGKADTPTLPRAAGDSSTSLLVTVKAPESSPARKVGERKDANELPLENSGVQTPTNVAAAPKRPHPPASSNKSAETTTPGTEEPPEKTLQGRRPSIRTRPNIPADKHGGNVEPVGLSTALPDDTAGDGRV